MLSYFVKIYGGCLVEVSHGGGGSEDAQDGSVGGSFYSPRGEVVGLLRGERWHFSSRFKETLGTGG